MVNMMNKFIDYIKNLEVGICAVLTAVITVTITAQIFFRYFLRNPLRWAEELSMFLLPWIVFIGTSALLKIGGHIKVTVIYDKFPERVRVVMDVIVDVLMIYILLMLIQNGWNAYKVQSVARTVVLKIPKGLFTLPQVIAGISMMLYAVTSLISRVKRLVYVFAANQAPSHEVKGG